MNEAKTSWRINENYHSQEFYIENDMLIHKDWFDPGKNPNINKISFNEILSGKLDYHFLMTLNISPWIFREIKENIKKIIEND